VLLGNTGARRAAGADEAPTPNNDKDRDKNDDKNNDKNDASGQNLQARRPKIARCAVQKWTEVDQNHGAMTRQNERGRRREGEIDREREREREEGESRCLRALARIPGLGDPVPCVQSEDEPAFPSCDQSSGIAGHWCSPL
jgi:hypothetical protein